MKFLKFIWNLSIDRTYAIRPNLPGIVIYKCYWFAPLFDKCLLQLYVCDNAEQYINKNNEYE